MQNDIPFDDDELLDPVKASLEKIRPYLMSDGGDIEIVKIEGGKVYVRLKGACQGCSHSHVTLKNHIEFQCKKDIHPNISVVEIK
ncbi:MAG: NifU family protein [Helicobacter sp.]|nr:NifU family protein [Helicobacter sp.]